MDEPVVISAKSLGELALSGFCPRCYWLKMHAQKLPFQIFPGIFSSIDSYSKRVTRGYFDQRQELLKWFQDNGLSGEPVKVPSLKNFQALDSASNITLRGLPDEILRLADGSYAILDYKTSKFTKNQAGLYPLYEAQLNAYAYLGERCGFNPVSRLELVYYEPVSDMPPQQIMEMIHENGFDMMFISNLRAVEIKPLLIPDLLMKARQIYDLPKAPEGAQDCADCSALVELMTLLK